MLLSSSLFWRNTWKMPINQKGPVPAHKYKKCINFKAPCSMGENAGFCLGKLSKYYKCSVKDTESKYNPPASPARHNL